MQRLLPLAALLAVLGWVDTASAQFLAPVRKNEGPGFTLSDSLVFHPGLSVDGRFDSNVFKETNNPQAAGLMRVQAQLKLETRSTSRLSDEEGEPVKPKLYLSADANLVYWDYFKKFDGASGVRRGLEVDAGVDLKAFSQGTFSFGLEADYVRSYPDVNIRRNVGRNTVRGVVPLIYRPGGGRLTFRLHYGINADIFEDGFRDFNKYFHEVALTAKWRLLPKSAVFLEVVQQFISYYDTTPNASYLLNQDSMPLRLYLGFSGLLTPRFSVLLKLGYGNGFYDEFDSYNMMLGKVELGYEIGPTAKVFLGFDHGFNDHFLANYHSDERVYLGYDQWFFNRVLAHLKGEYIYRNYDGFNPNYPFSDVKNHILKAGVAVDFRVLDWLFLGLGYDLDLRDNASVTTNATSINLNNADVFRGFVKHQVFGKVEVTY